LSVKSRDKENIEYDKSPKHYHHSLKFQAGLLPRAIAQPRVEALEDPKPKSIHAKPEEVTEIVTTHYKK
jgi:hypothetical protein